MKMGHFQDWLSQDPCHLDALTPMFNSDTHWLTFPSLRTQSCLTVEIKVSNNLGRVPPEMASEQACSYPKKQPHALQLLPEAAKRKSGFLQSFTLLKRN